MEINWGDRGEHESTPEYNFLKHTETTFANAGKNTMIIVK